MSLEEKLANLQSLIDQMETVEDLEFVYAKHMNPFVDWLTDAVDVCKILYDMFKAKTGKTLPDVEFWLDMAETRLGFTRKAKFGDIVLTKDHNLIIDTMKPLELVLITIEENL
jgi:hypothetical protein